MTENSGWITAIAGLSLDRSRRVQFGDALSAEDFGRLLSPSADTSVSSRFRPALSVVSDPGAYFSYCAAATPQTLAHDAGQSRLERRHLSNRGTNDLAPTRKLVASRQAELSYADHVNFSPPPTTVQVKPTTQ